jgi:hypothetical protein
MAVIDLVGTPFPKDHPLFLNKRLRQLIRQLESYIEIKWDLQDISLFLQQASFIKTPEDIEKIKIIHAPLAQEAMIISAVIAYGKLFKSSTNRTVLNARDIHWGESAGYHRFLIDLRDKFLAHQEWNANRHYLHYFKNPSSEAPTLNPDGYTVRIPIAGNVNIENFLECVGHVEAVVKARIASLCASFQSMLTAEQIEFLNSDQPDPTNPFHKQPAFASRSLN